MRPAPLPPALRSRSFSVHDAVSRGVAPQRLRRTDLVAPYHGVRAAADWNGTVVDRCLAYATRMPRHHAFSGPTAAKIWGIPLTKPLDDDPRLHVVALGGARAPRGVGIAGSRTGRAAVTSTRHGLRLLSPAETWASLASMMPLDDLVAAGDRLLGLPVPLASPAEVDRALADARGRRGARRLSQAAALVRPNVFSPRESRTRLLIARSRPGAAEPEPNGVIALHHGATTRGDLVFRAERVVVEYEGEHHLTDPVQWARDLERYNDLALSGWLVIRLSRRMGDDEIVARVSAALRSRH